MTGDVATNPSRNEDTLCSKDQRYVRKTFAQAQCNKMMSMGRGVDTFASKYLWIQLSQNVCKHSTIVCAFLENVGKGKLLGERSGGGGHSGKNEY